MSPVANASVTGSAANAAARAALAPMSGAHQPAQTVVHRLPAEVKVAGAVAFVVVVAATPQRAAPVLAAQLIVALGLVALARLELRVVVRRLAVVAPFLVTAALLPLVAGGEQVEVVGIGLSVDGLWSAGAIGAKTLIGVLTSIVVSATTPTPVLVASLGRLRLPPVLVAIASFMVRYLDLLVDEVRRRRTAMVARGWRPRSLRQAAPVAATLGTLFVRSYERGERVHAAMVSRGYTGVMPVTDTAPIPGTRNWLTGAVPALVAAAALVLWLLAR